MNLLFRYFSLTRLQLFIGIVLVNLIIVWLSKSVLINDIVIYNTFSEQLTYDRSLKLFEDLKRLAWISYAFTPIMLIIKFVLISLVLYTGILLYNIQNRISIGSVIKIVIASEIIFVFASLLKFFWFYLFAGNYDLNDMGFFYPLSLTNFFTTLEVNRIWVFPMQTANLFQIAYIIAIAYGLDKICKIDKADAEKIVLMSYLPALVIWIAFIMFLSIDSVL